MLPYSLRLALRHFSRKRIYSFIIVLSLTVGFACTCLLISFLVGEQSVDSFHSKRDRLFELVSNDPFGGTGRINYTTAPTRDYMIDTYAEVENICQVSDIAHGEIEIDGNSAQLATIGVDTSFFTMFDFPLIAGSKKDITSGLMITSGKARQMFGTSDVLGRIVNFRTADSSKLVVITGVIGAPPEKSHLKFDAIIGHSLIEPVDPKNRPGGVTYVLLHKDIDATSFNLKINADSLRPTLLSPGEMDY